MADRTSQRASSLVETAIAVAIAALIAGAALNAVIAATRTAGIDPARNALESSVQREMTIARDVLKYGGADVAPATVATTLPMPAGSPLPALLSIETTRLAHGALRIVVSAQASGRSDERAALSATLSERAPLPGVTVRARALVPAPTGAP